MSAFLSIMREEHQSKHLPKSRLLHIKTTTHGLDTTVASSVAESEPSTSSSAVATMKTKILAIPAMLLERALPGLVSGFDSPSRKPVVKSYSCILCKLLINTFQASPAHKRARQLGDGNDAHKRACRDLDVRGDGKDLKLVAEEWEYIDLTTEDD
jgi:hypothetical protein